MDQSQHPDQRPTYLVRFEGGPRDATQTAVLGLDSGRPPDVLLTPGHPSWFYVLAGGARTDGSWPYLWMPESRVAALERLGADRTAHLLANTS